MSDFTSDDDTSEDLAAMLGSLVLGRFRSAIAEHLEGLDYVVSPKDQVGMRADGLVRAAHRADAPVLGVAVLLLIALHATDGLDLGLAALLDAARAVPREELARHLPAAVLEAVPLD